MSCWTPTPRSPTAGASRTSAPRSRTPSPAPTSSQGVHARVELERFVEELARCTGLAGRSRSFPHNTERARVSVHKAIKRAIRAITEIDQALGREIDARIVTGTTCVFLAGAPRPPATVSGPDGPADGA